MPILPTLAARWQILALDLRGHGGSDRFEDEYFLTNYIDDVAAALVMLREPAVILGHSLGAMAALGAAARGSPRSRALVLLDPAFTLPDESDPPLFLDILRRLQAIAIETPDPTGRRLAMESIPIRDPQTGAMVPARTLVPPTQLRWNADCLGRTDPAVFDPVLAGRWTADFDFRSVAERVGCPVLVLQCDPELGGLLSDDAAAALVDVAPDATLVPLPGVGHELLATHPETVLRLILPFLESVRD